MPVITPRYKLTAFGRGDFYSASADQNRMRIIDNHMGFLADRIGDGRINGWDVEVENANQFTFSISSGIGVIDRFISRSFNDYELILNDNRTIYLYMRRKANIVGGFSGFSNLGTITHTDTTAPATPTGLTAASQDYLSVDLEWDANTEVDLDHYTIYRGENAVSLSELTTSTTNSYTDTAVEQNTNYYYKIDAVDKSDNASSATSTTLVKVKKDLRVPLNVGVLQTLALDGGIQVLWTAAKFSPIDHYEIHYEELNTAFEPISATTEISKSSTSTQHIIHELTNNVPYRVTVYTVGINDIFSPGVSAVVIPTSNQGPLDIEDLEVTFTEGRNEGNAFMNISWTPQFDPYLAMPTRYDVTIVENGVDTSELIPVADATSLEVEVLTFLSGEIRSLKERTVYTVIIQVVDENTGRRSTGVMILAESPSFRTPPPATSLTVTENADQSLFFTWINSKSPYISHHLLTVRITDIDSGAITTVLNQSNYGLANTYTLASSYFDFKKEFEFRLKAVDIYDNESIERSVTFSTPDIDLTDKPSVPPNQGGDSGDGQVKLTWGQSLEPAVSNYRVWRSGFGLILDATDFTLIDTVPSTVTQYIDYTVSNGTSYIYFVTTVDAFGRESLNPSDDGFFSYPYIIGTPRVSANFTAPSGLTITAGSPTTHDVTVSWSVTTGEFDGYQLFRSIGNKYSFEVLSSTGPSTTSYVDEDVLLESGSTYSYLVRKFINEVEPFITESSVKPSASTLIAKIVINNGEISIDESVARELANLEDVIKEEATRQINAHKHDYDELPEGVALSVSDWETTDYKNYTTATALNSNHNYLLYINNAESNIDFWVDTTNGTLTFRETLFDPSGDTNTPFTAAPSILLASIGTDRRVNLSNSIVITDWSTSDFKSYSTTADITGASSYVVRLNGEITDLLYQIDSTLSIISFSHVLFSANPLVEGEFTDPPNLTVELIGVEEVQGILPAHRVESNLNTSVMTSGRIRNAQLPELEHAGRMKETLIPIKESMVTADNINYHVTSGSEISLVDSLTFYDVLHVDDDTLLAATSNGILKSDDFGSEWEVVSTTKTAPHKLYYASAIDTYFALSNKRIYFSTGGVEKWTAMKGAETARVYRDIIVDEEDNVYLSTDIGVFKLAKATIESFFQWEYTSIFGPRSLESYALLYDSREDRIIVSNELGIFESFDNGTSWSFSSEFSELVPIFRFVQSGDYIFALTRTKIWRKTGSGDFVEIAEMDISLARRMELYENRLYVTTSSGLLVSALDSNVFNDAEVDMVSALPQMNISGRFSTAHSLSLFEDLLVIGAETRLFMLDDSDNIWLQHETDEPFPPTVFIDDVIQFIGYRYNNSDNTVSFDNRLAVSKNIEISSDYNSYLAGNGGWYDQNPGSEIVVRKNGIEIGRSESQDSSSSSQDLVEIPSIGLVVDPRTGIFTFEEELKKTDTVEVDILGATLFNIGTSTHREVEDAMELVNSGLPSSLSRVYQVNLTKTGIFTEKNFPGEQADRAPAYQAQYSIPRDRQWYDSFNSTVDYTIEISNETLGPNLRNVSTAVYVPSLGKVLAGGLGSLLSIDTTTLNIINVSPDEDNLNIRQLHVKDDGSIILATSERIYNSIDGTTWVAVDRTGLPNDLYSIGYIHNVIVVGASDGVYIRPPGQSKWERRVSSETPVYTIDSPDALIAVVDNDVMRTVNGLSYSSVATSTSVITNVIKHGGLFFIATQAGLFNDGGTFYGDEGAFSLATILNNPNLSKALVVNDIDSDGERLVVALNDGTYYVRQFDVYTLVSDTHLDTIHKVVIVEDDVWAFGNDSLKVASIDMPIRLTDSVSF